MCLWCAADFHGCCGGHAIALILDESQDKAGRVFPPPVSLESVSTPEMTDGTDWSCLQGHSISTSRMFLVSEGGLERADCLPVYKPVLNLELRKRDAGPRWAT